VCDLQSVLEHWRYVALFIAVILGNMGVPVPEETTLALAGYLAARGIMRLPAVIATGIVSAVVGDNLGYWLGRHYGRAAIERHESGLLGSSGRLARVTGFVRRHGAFAVLLARFVPGFRFLAGPVAGTMGMPPIRFTIANALGAIVYVPYAVGIGYAVGYRAGDVVQRAIDHPERLAMIAVVVLTIALIAHRMARRLRAGGSRIAGGT
jgi:membrane protein DedA with SNARE-associated domain